MKCGMHIGRSGAATRGVFNGGEELMGVELVDGIPLPKRVRKGSLSRYNFHKMALGQAFFLSLERSPRDIRSLHTLARPHGIRISVRRLSVDFEGRPCEGYGVWRVE